MIWGAQSGKVTLVLDGSSSRHQTGELYQPIKEEQRVLGCQTSGPYCLQQEQLAALGRWAPLADGRGAA